MTRESDIALVEAMRAAIGDCELRADVNGAWTPGTAKRQLERLKPYDLSYIEQPLELDDLLGHAELRRSQPIPVALDESAYTLADVGNIVRMERRTWCSSIRTRRRPLAGGEAGGDLRVRWHPRHAAFGGELALSQAAYVHLAAAIPNMTVSIDTEQTYLASDIASNGPRLRDGGFDVPTAPGLGVDPDVAMLEKLKVDGIAGAYLDPSRPGWFPVSHRTETRRRLLAPVPRARRRVHEQPRVGVAAIRHAESLDRQRSTISPCRITATSSQRWATMPRSCVTSSAVRPVSRRIADRRLRISAWTEASRAEVGSSSSRISGSSASARAMATR